MISEARNGKYAEHHSEPWDRSAVTIFHLQTSVWLFVLLLEI